MSERIPEDVFVDKFDTQLACVRYLIDSGLHTEDSFFVIDLDEVVKKYKLWKQLLPRVEMHYAVKCSDRKEILEVLAALGSSFDCASKGEISQVLAMGVDSSRIIFANACKLYSHINYAAEVGIRCTTFDSANELRKMKELYPNAKFGCDPITEAPDLLRLAADLGLDVAGVSFHGGSGCKDPDIYGKAISVARNLFDQAKNLGHQMHFLDIGGGFPGDDNAMVEKISQVVNSALEDFFRDRRVRVVGEPGRFVVTSSATAAGFVIGKKLVFNSKRSKYLPLLKYQC